MLKVKQRGVRVTKFVPHALAHRADIVTQDGCVTWLREHVSSYGFKLGRDFRLSGQRTGADQGLVFPSPGGVSLVLAERRDGGHQQTRRATWTQPHVEFVSGTRGGSRGQQMNDSLRQPGEKQIIGERFGAVGLLGLRVAIVNEHEIEIRRIPKFQATELAIGNNCKTRRQGLAIQLIARPAVFGHQVSPRQGACAVDQDLRDPRQMIADVGDWEIHHQITGRDPQHLLMLV